MKPENAINFLLYSYFELTLDSTNEEIINAAINRAYRDASSRVLSITEETNYTKNADGEKITLRDAATQYLTIRINALEPGIDYSKWHATTCDYMVGTIYAGAKNNEEKDAFHFGHAQKWVNMTMKYLYVIKSIFEKYGRDCAILKKLTESLEKQLHVPVDSYILEAASLKDTVKIKKETKGFKYGLGIDLPQKNGGLGSFSNAKSWSTWEPGDYTDFREELSGKFTASSPLDWEGPAWIEIAKIRKEREK